MDLKGQQHTERLFNQTGLKNLGNTCYMNSAIQALYACDSFRDELIQCKPNEASKVTVELRKVFALLTSSKCQTVEPRSLFKVARPSYFSVDHQEDSSEFLRHVLNEIDEEFAKATTKTSRERRSNSPRTSMTSVVRRLFGIQTVNKYTCIECQNSNDVPDDRLDLVVPFPCDHATAERPSATTRNGFDDNRSESKVSGLSTGNPNRGALGTAGDYSNQSRTTAAECSTEPLQLTDLLKSFEEEEKINLHCEDCKKITESTRKTSIKKYPPYLILILGRFRVSQEEQLVFKNMAPVRYPLDIKLPIMNSGKEKVHCYKLKAAVVHIGSSLHSGHYTCYTEQLNGMWCHYNDGAVSEETQPHVDSRDSITTSCILIYTTETVYNPIPQLTRGLHNYVKEHDEMVANNEEVDKQAKQLVEQYGDDVQQLTNFAEISGLSDHKTVLRQVHHLLSQAKSTSQYSKEDDDKAERIITVYGDDIELFLGKAEKYGISEHRWVKEHVKDILSEDHPDQSKPPRVSPIIREKLGKVDRPRHTQTETPPLHGISEEEEKRALKAKELISKYGTGTKDMDLLLGLAEAHRLSDHPLITENIQKMLNEQCEARKEKVDQNTSEAGRHRTCDYTDRELSRRPIYDVNENVDELVRPLREHNSDVDKKVDDLFKQGNRQETDCNRGGRHDPLSSWKRDREREKETARREEAERVVNKYGHDVERLMSVADIYGVADHEIVVKQLDKLLKEVTTKEKPDEQRREGDLYGQEVNSQGVRVTRHYYPQGISLVDDDHIHTRPVVSRTQDPSLRRPLTESYTENPSVYQRSSYYSGSNADPVRTTARSEDVYSSAASRRRLGEYLSSSDQLPYSDRYQSIGRDTASENYSPRDIYNQLYSGSSSRSSVVSGHDVETGSKDSTEGITGHSMYSGSAIPDFHSDGRPGYSSRLSSRGTAPVHSYASLENSRKDHGQHQDETSSTQKSGEIPSTGVKADSVFKETTGSRPTGLDLKSKVTFDSSAKVTKDKATATSLSSRGSDSTTKTTTTRPSTVKGHDSIGKGSVSSRSIGSDTRRTATASSSPKPAGTDSKSKETTSERHSATKRGNLSSKGAGTDAKHKGSVKAKTGSTTTMHKGGSSSRPGSTTAASKGTASSKSAGRDSTHSRPSSSSKSVRQNSGRQDPGRNGTAVLEETQRSVGRDWRSSPGSSGLATEESNRSGLVPDIADDLALQEETRAARLKYYEKHYKKK